jgi:hypothetical protein
LFENPLSGLVDAVDWIDPAARLPSPATRELGEIIASAAWIASQTAVVKKSRWTSSRTSRKGGFRPVEIRYAMARMRK